MLLLVLLVSQLSPLSAAAAVGGEEPKNWVVLVAGSNSWMNYRHQADACHAYQIVRKNGIPEERIITMMYDDIAHNRENPTPGKIINRPNGPDVYQGVKIDYQKEEVNPKNFLKVLSGDKEGMRGIGNGRVLESGPNDHVFVNFVDHGAPGILAFGREFLHASDLHSTIMKMHENKKYKKMVFYVEACESGSIFINDLLPKDINVFATTAANAHESSYACYFDKARKTYLGDVYSIKWMEDADKEDLSTETLTKQFEIVRRETNTSHVQEFGDLEMGSMDVGEFLGKDKKGVFDNNPVPDPCSDAVPSEDVGLNILLLKIQLAQEPQKQQYKDQLNELRQMRQKTQAIFKHIVALSIQEGDSALLQTLLTTHRDLHSFQCYQEVVEHLKDTCQALNLVQNDYALRQLYTLVNLCQQPVPRETIKEAIDDVATRTDLCK